MRSTSSGERSSSVDFLGDFAMAGAPTGRFTLPAIPQGMTLSVLESNNEIATLIGHVVGRWAMVERLLVLIYRRAHRCSQQSAEVTLYSLGNFKARIDVTRNSVVELMTADADQEEILWVLGKLQDSSDMRNKLVHGTWMVKLDGTFVRRNRRPGSTNPDTFQKPNASEIKDHLDKIGRCVLRLADIIAPEQPAQRRWPSAWRKIPRRLRLGKSHMAS